MKLVTKFKELIEVQEEDILYFEGGLPGFEDQKKFVLIPLDDTPFSILQSAVTPKLAFIIADPFVFYKHYDFELSINDQEQLKVNNPKDITVFVIVTITEQFKKSTVNLQAPVIINNKLNIGKQIVLTDSKYKTRHLMTEPDLIGKEG